MSDVVAERPLMQPLSHADVDEMVAIEERAYAFPWTRGNFIDSLTSGYSVWGGRSHGKLVGYFVLMPVFDEAHLLNLSVAPLCQRIGYGSLLLQYALLVAREVHVPHPAASQRVQQRILRERRGRLPGVGHRTGHRGDATRGFEPAVAPSTSADLERRVF